MAEKSIFLDVVGDSPVMRLLQYLIEGRHFDYTLTDLARNAGISWATLYAIFPKLLKYGIIKKVREVGRAKLYKINEENEIARYFIKLYDYISEINLKKLEREKLVSA
jgi:DNA-binding transcriptional ArsR family regulator